VRLERHLVGTPERTNYQSEAELDCGPMSHPNPLFSPAQPESAALLEKYVALVPGTTSCDFDAQRLQMIQSVRDGAQRA